jgi:hypothetical protein
MLPSLISQLKSFSVNSRKLLAYKPTSLLLLVSQPKHLPHTPFLTDSKTSLLSHAPQVSNSQKPPNSSLQLRTPQLLELQAHQQRLLLSLKRKKKSQKPSIWEASSVMMMMNTEPRPN